MDYRDMCLRVYDEANEAISQLDSLAEELVQLRRKKEELVSQLASRKAEISLSIASNPDMKNDTMRKAAIELQLQSDSVQAELGATELAIDAVQLQMETVRHRISVRKALLYAAGGMFGEPTAR
jgi:chromosome segregation ATPase